MEANEFPSKINQQKNQKLFTIGKLAKKCNLTSQAIRFYEKIGLIKPDYIDPETKYRFYSENQIPILVSIKELKYKGFQLEDIEKFLSTGNLNEIESLFQKRQNQIMNQIFQLQQYHDLLSKRIDFFHLTKTLEKEQSLQFNPNEILFKILPDRPVLFVRQNHSQFSISKNMALFNELQNLIRKYKLHTLEPMMNIFYGTYSQINQIPLDFEALIELKKIPDKNHPFIRILPGGHYLSFYHKGSNQNVIETEKKLFQWMKQNNLQPIGPLIRCYLITYSISKSIETVVSEFQIQIQSNS